MSDDLIISIPKPKWLPAVAFVGYILANSIPISSWRHGFYDWYVGTVSKFYMRRFDRILNRMLRTDGA